jgi:hypothetical protein
MYLPRSNYYFILNTNFIFNTYLDQHLEVGWTCILLFQKPKFMLYCIYSLSFYHTDMEIVISIECEKHLSKFICKSTFQIKYLENYSTQYIILKIYKDKK